MHLVYLDMDGLLANLFDTVGHKFEGKPYHEARDKIKAHSEIIWTQKDKFVEKFGCVETFFAELPLFGKDGEITYSIINTVIELFGEYRICSHPAIIDPEASERGKIRWINQHLSKCPPVECVFPENKADFAKNGRVPNILIDDHTPLLKKWETGGGIGIKMRSDKFKNGAEAKAHLQRELSPYLPNRIELSI
jgi:hypothetical protein